MAEDGIDYLAFSGHKMYAPFGSGALIVKKGTLTFDPTELEQIKASGEENVVGVAAMGKAMTLLERIGLDVIQDEERALTQRALRGLTNIPDIEIFGLHDPDSPEFHRISDLNLKDVSLKEALQSKFLRTIRESHAHSSETNSG